MRNGAFGILTGAVAILILAGCQRPQQAPEPPNERQARLLAVQSADLQRQLAAREAEIDAVRKRHAEELQRRDDELARCKARIELLQKDVEKGIAERASGVATALLEENAKLRKEIERLQAEVDRLKAAAAGSI
jgi:uncharacterized lipoprotein YajG